MPVSKLALTLLAPVVPASAAIALLAHGGTGEVAFPTDFSDRVRYAIIERADTKQYLELFAPPEAIAAAKKGEPLPDGTVLTMLRFKIRLDAAGNLVRDAAGHLVKEELVGYSVMEKHRGWGAEHPAPLRNGEWAFRRFTAAGDVDNSLSQIACLQCHKRREKHDFIFSRANMVAAN